jgi:hypothetical protein
MTLSHFYPLVRPLHWFVALKFLQDAVSQKATAGGPRARLGRAPTRGAPTRHSDTLGTVADMLPKQFRSKEGDRKGYAWTAQTNSGADPCN